MIEQRWRSRFGGPTVDALAASLAAVFAALDITPPAYLPMIMPTQDGRLEQPADAPGPGSAHVPGDLSALLSGVLWAFTRDVEATARISMSIGSNLLRVLGPGGVRPRDLPQLTGVSKEANAMCSGWLERRGYLTVEPDPDAARGKVVRLTPKGVEAQRTFERTVVEVEDRWRARDGAPLVSGLRAALEPLVGAGTLPDSPLAGCLETYPDNWRAGTKRPGTLPHYPMGLHRGGYPDGS